MKAIKKVFYITFLISLTVCSLYSCIDKVNYKEPHINRIQKVEAVEYADTEKFCNSNCEIFFCVLLKDYIDEINYSHRCANCGDTWGHHKTRYEWCKETMPYQD